MSLYYFRLVVMNHVGILRWHSPKTLADMKQWGKMLNRGGKFKMSMSTKVCSNHFAAGYCSDVCPIPAVYLKGYDISSTPKRTVPKRRTLFQPETSAPKRRKHIHRNSGEDTLDVSNLISPMPRDHDYELSNTENSASKSIPYSSCSNCKKTRKNTGIFLKKISEYEKELANLQTEIHSYKSMQKRFSVSVVKNDDELIQFYTGLPNYAVFNWLYNRIKYKAERLHYFRGDASFITKSHQLNTKKHKSGKSRQLSTEGKELEGHIVWPNREQVLQYYPICFKSFSNIIGIIDCTEGTLEKPSFAKAQRQTYSTYKSRNT